MAITLGAISFWQPLVWKNKSKPVVIGSDVRARDGEIISIRGTDITQHQYATLAYEWEPWSTVVTLRTYWAAGGTYTMKPEDGATTYTVRFQAQDGVTEPKHVAFGTDVAPDAMAGTYLDYWSGEINVVIIA
jgi:hypothetical protein